jgi:hypothetical protein
MNKLWLVYSLVYYESKLEKSIPNVALKFLMKTIMIYIYNIKLSQLIKIL